jgi:putative transposase
MMKAQALSQRVGVRPACTALGVPESSFYRRLGGKPSGQKRPRSTPARALNLSERHEVLERLCSERFVDRAPAEVVATLLDEGTYLCSERTMYRILASERAVKERREQRRHPTYQRPELVAQRPNEVWTWDITRLRGPQSWKWYYLYVILDIYSRYVVGWMAATRESAELACHLISETHDKWDVEPDQLILHNDRGGPMIASETAQLLARLNITPSLSRPRVSNDNPFSESQFKTLKYGSTFPRRFGGLEHVLDYGRGFFSWYNDEHRHSGIAMLTPADVHFGRAQAVLQERNRVMAEAFENTPERFPRGTPTVPKLDRKVYINKPNEAETAH